MALVDPDDDTQLKIGSMFSGVGGLDLAVERVTGGRVVWHAEHDPSAGVVLRARWPGVPNLGDITRITWAQVPPVDVLTGGFPCQDVSLAGRRAGLRAGTRSGLWARMVQAIDVLRPRLVVIENVRGLLSAAADSDVEPCPWCLGDDHDEPALRALGAVLGDLAGLGFDAEWTGLRAADVGAPHGRFRVFVVGWPAGHPYRVDIEGRQAAGLEREAGPAARPSADTDGIGPVRRGGARDRRNGPADSGQGLVAADHARWGRYGPAVARWECVVGRPAPAPTEAGERVDRRLSPRFVEWMMGLPPGWVVDVVSRRDALRLLGNAVVPQQAERAITGCLTDQVTRPPGRRGGSARSPAATGG